MFDAIYFSAALAGLACGLALVAWAVRDFTRFVRRLCDDVRDAIDATDDASDQLRGDRP